MLLNNIAEMAAAAPVAAQESQRNELIELLATVLHFIPKDEPALYQDVERVCSGLRASQPAQGERQPVGIVRHFVYEGIARNGPSVEVTLFEGVNLPDGTHLYAE